MSLKYEPSSGPSSLSQLSKSNPKPQTLNPKPQTPYPQPRTPNPKISGSDDKLVKIWNTQTGDEVRAFHPGDCTT